MTLGKASVFPSVAGDKHLLRQVGGLATAPFFPPGPQHLSPGAWLPFLPGTHFTGPATALSSPERDGHASCPWSAWHTVGAAGFCTHHGVPLSCHLYSIPGRGGEDGEEDKGRGGEEAGARRREREGVGGTGKDREKEESGRNSIPVAFPMLRLLPPALQSVPVRHASEPHGPDCLSRKFLLHI